MSALTAKKQQLLAENPFYGKSATLNLFQQLPKVDDAKVAKSTVFTLLSAAAGELVGSKEGRELLCTLIFSIGDVQNREHNIFQKLKMKDVDQGGNSKRRTFIFCLEWLLNHSPEQFYKFLPIIGEYYNLDGTMMYELRTDRYKGTLLETLRIPVDVDRVTTYIASVLKDTRTTPNEKKMWAKWLPHIPSHKRTRKYEITEKNIKSFRSKSNPKLNLGDRVQVSKEKNSHTVTKDNWTFTFIKSLSGKMDWEVVKHAKNLEFIGYKQFKKTHLSDSEAYLFSSQLIKSFDKTQLLEWFNQLPSDARYRVSRRVVDKDKTSGKLTPASKWVTTNGTNIGAAYIEWLGMKEKAQQQVRDLTPEAKANLAPVELKKLEKAARVNTGATNLLDLFAKVLNKKASIAEIDTVAHSILEQIKMEVPVFVVADISGSMSSASMVHGGVEFTASAMSKLATTIFLLKNPDPTLEPFFVRFQTVADVITTGSKVSNIASGANRYMSTSSTVVDEIINRQKSFSYNLASVSKFLTTTGGTNLNSIAQALKVWVDSEPAFKSQRIEMINAYQVMLVISDGDINSHSSAAQSVLTFQRDMQQWFGWNGVIVLWDVKEASSWNSGGGGKFEGLENIMYFGGTNYGVVNQIFKNISDLDLIDGYLPLKSLHASSRYLPVKNLVL